MPNAWYYANYLHISLTLIQISWAAICIGPILAHHQAEFTPAKVRGAALCSNTFMWTVGALMVSGTAWGVLGPRGSWRILIYVVSAPMLLGLALGVLYLPESPRWLLTKGRDVEAKTVVMRAATMNDVKLKDDFDLVETLGEMAGAGAGAGAGACAGAGAGAGADNTATTDTPKPFLHEFTEVLHPDRRAVTLPSWGVWVTLGFG
jgi:MFS family permease